MTSAELAFLIYCRLKNIELIEDKELRLEKLEAVDNQIAELQCQVTFEVIDAEKV